MKCSMCGRRITKADREKKRYVTSRATGKHYGKCCYVSAGTQRGRRTRRNGARGRTGELAE